MRPDPFPSLRGRFFNRSQIDRCPAVSRVQLVRCELELPGRCASQDSCTRKFTLTIRMRCQKPSLRVCFRSGSCAVLPPQRLLDVVHYLCPLSVTLPFPEQHKTKSTDAAMKLRVPIRPSAQHLHRFFLVQISLYIAGRRFCSM